MDPQFLNPSLWNSHNSQVWESGMSKHMLRLDIPTPNLDTFNKSIVSVHASPHELTILFYLSC